MNKPPQADVDSERAALGAAMCHEQAADVLCEMLRPTDFMTDLHRAIFAEIVALRVRDAVADEVSVVSAAQGRGTLEACGGREYVGNLITTTPGPTGIETYCRALLGRSEMRKLWALSASLADGIARGTDVSRLLGTAQKELDEIWGRRAGVANEPLDLHGLAAQEAAEALAGPRRDYWGLPCGLAGGVLDEYMGGFSPGTYVILSGRTSMGKSTLAMHITRGIRACNPNAGIPLYITNEMSPTALSCSALASAVGISIRTFLRRAFSPDNRAALQRIISQRELEGVHLCDLAGGTIAQVKAIIRRHQRAHNGSFVVVDMAGRLDAPGHEDKEVARLTAISKGLQALAKELRVCIMACVQVGRQALLNKDKRPGLGDLKGTGSWEDDADYVIFVHRLDYYGDTSDPRTELIIAKDRITGCPGSVFIMFNRNLGRFVKA